MELETKFWNVFAVLIGFAGIFLAPTANSNCAASFERNERKSKIIVISDRGPVRVFALTRGEIESLPHGTEIISAFGEFGKWKGTRESDTVNFDISDRSKTELTTWGVESNVFRSLRITESQPVQRDQVLSAVTQELSRGTRFSGQRSNPVQDLNGATLGSAIGGKNSQIYRARMRSIGLFLAEIATSERNWIKAGPESSSGFGTIIREPKLLAGKIIIGLKSSLSAELDNAPFLLDLKSRMDRVIGRVQEAKIVSIDGRPTWVLAIVGKEGKSDIELANFHQVHWLDERVD